jgi:hypothetical protein
MALQGSDRIFRTMTGDQGVHATEKCIVKTLKFHAFRCYKILVEVMVFILENKNGSRPLQKKPRAGFILSFYLHRHAIHPLNGLFMDKETILNRHTAGSNELVRETGNRFGTDHRAWA